MEGSGSLRAIIRAQGYITPDQIKKNIPANSSLERVMRSIRSMGVMVSDLMPEDGNVYQADTAFDKIKRICDDNVDAGLTGYVRELASLPLLTIEGERTIGLKIEESYQRITDHLFRLPTARAYVIEKYRHYRESCRTNCLNQFMVTFMDLPVPEYVPVSKYNKTRIGPGLSSEFVRARMEEIGEIYDRANKAMGDRGINSQQYIAATEALHEKMKNLRVNFTVAVLLIDKLRKIKSRIDLADHQEARVIELEERLGIADILKIFDAISNELPRYLTLIDMLVRANLRLAVLLAKRFLPMCLDFATLDDLIQVANLGLTNAAHRFDLRRCRRFMTYGTYWIHRYLTLFHEKNFSLAYIPNAIGRIKNHYRNIVSTYQLQKDDLGECARIMGLSEQRLRTALETNPSHISFDEPIGGDGEYCLHDVIQHGGDPVDEICAKQQIAALIMSAIEQIWLEHKKKIKGRRPRLDYREIISFRFGLGSYMHAHTLAEVGMRFGATIERVRQVEHKFIMQLKECECLKALL